VRGDNGSQIWGHQTIGKEKKKMKVANFRDKKLVERGKI
jgi:hypothetical protein